MIGSLIIMGTAFVVGKLQPDYTLKCIYNDETVVGSSVELYCVKNIK